jgi:hypothetical protein
MKKVLGIALALASLGVFGMASEAKAAASENSAITTSASPQWQWQRDRYGQRGYNRRRARTFRQSRIVRFGRRLYRETFLVTYFPSGRTNTRLISRVRIA